MKIKVRTGSQNKFRLNENLANDFSISDGDIFEMEFGKNQILLTKLEPEQQEEQ